MRLIPMLLCTLPAAFAAAGAIYTADSRYVTEDVPYGLVATAMLGDLAGAPAALHWAGVRLFSAMYGRDFTRENDLLTALDLKRRSLAELAAAARSGHF